MRQRARRYATSPCCLAPSKRQLYRSKSVIGQANPPADNHRKQTFLAGNDGGSSGRGRLARRVVLLRSIVMDGIAGVPQDFAH